MQQHINSTVIFIFFRTLRALPPFIGLPDALNRCRLTSLYLFWGLCIHQWINICIKTHKHTWTNRYERKCTHWPCWFKRLSPTLSLTVDLLPRSMSIFEVDKQPSRTHSGQYRTCQIVTNWLRTLASKRSSKPLNLWAAAMSTFESLLGPTRGLHSLTRNVTRGVRPCFACFGIHNRRGRSSSRGSGRCLHTIHDRHRDTLQYDSWPVQVSTSSTVDEFGIGRKS